MLNYTPLTPDQFIGPAQRVATQLHRLVSTLNPRQDRLALLLYGQPGVGKSAIAGALATYLGVNKFSSHRYSGTQLNLDRVEDLARSLHYTDFFSSWRYIWIDEADKIPHIAQVRFLTLLDDLPPGNAIVCTCNSAIDQLEERFQTRFQAIEIHPPTDAEIIQLIQRLEPSLPDQTANWIAVNSCGNVRCALKEIATHQLAAA